MSHEDIRLHAGPLADWVAALFVADGMAANDAAQVAQALVWADLRGADTHGVMRAPGYLGMIETGVMNPKAVPELRSVGLAAFALDARRAPGAVAVNQAIAATAECARLAGVGFGVVGETTHFGAAGFYASQLAEKGLAGIVYGSGMPIMAYHGARVPALSTAPLAIAVPGPEGPLLVDLASSIVSNGRLIQARRAGQAIPSDWALDADGRPTTDPAKASVLLPLGGPKGSGLAFMFECLASVLASAPALAAMLAPGAPRKHVQTAGVIAINISAFRPLDDFRRDIGEFAAAVRALPRAEGVVDIILPGERGARIAALQTREGITLAPAIWTLLAQASQARNIAVPPPLP